ncbi:MAG: alpha/beta hydrolase [Candidatus Eisenbacteria sp.]|nr:alpha/beta hydrolase [Candidatus Eisenbacteria bacterium]
MIRVIVTILTVLVGLYLLYAGYYFLMQRRILFPRDATQLPDQDVAALYPELERLQIEAGGERVEAWYLPPIRASAQSAVQSAAEPGLSSPPLRAPVFTVAHGNAELIDDWPPRLTRLRQLGAGVLLVEYPGYGRSPGAPTQASITAVFVAAHDLLVAREDVDPERIGCLGWSVGAGAACALAAERPLRVLVLMAAFTSIRAMAGEMLLPGWLARDRFDNLAVVRACTAPVLIVHGRHDRTIAPAHGEALYHAARHGRLISYDVDHNDCPPDWDAFWRDAEPFLREVGFLASGL